MTIKSILDNNHNPLFCDLVNSGVIFLVYSEGSKQLNDQWILKVEIQNTVEWINLIVKYLKILDFSVQKVSCQSNFGELL